MYQPWVMLIYVNIPQRKQRFLRFSFEKFLHLRQMFRFIYIMLCGENKRATNSFFKFYIWFYKRYCIKINSNFAYWSHVQMQSFPCILFQNFPDLLIKFTQFTGLYCQYCCSFSELSCRNFKMIGSNGVFYICNIPRTGPPIIFFGR